MSSKARKRPPGPHPRSTAPAPRPGRQPGIRFRVDFHDRCSVGIGKINLLEAIARSRSLSQAARAIGMSYRRAWLLIDSLNAQFDTAVTSATVGGSGGGGAQLTPFGRELVEAYRKLEERFASLTAQYMSGAAAHVTGPAPRAASGRGPQRQRLSRPLK